MTHGPGYPIQVDVGMALAKSIYAVPTRTRLVALVTEPGALRATDTASTRELRMWPNSRLPENPHSPCVRVRMPIRAPAASLDGHEIRARRPWSCTGFRSEPAAISSASTDESSRPSKRHASSSRCDLYHAGLVVELDVERYTIELTPSPDADAASRGVVAAGAVGCRVAGRLRVFPPRGPLLARRSIPDLGDAVGGPRRLR